MEIEISFNSVIISFVETKMANPEFVQKIKSKMAEQNLGIRDLARKLGVSHPTVTELVTYGKKPSFDTCVALAEWLMVPPVSVLRDAGLLPPGPENQAQFEDWQYLLSQLPADEQEEMRQVALLKIERRKKAEAAALASNRKLRTTEG